MVTPYGVESSFKDIFAALDHRSSAISGQLNNEEQEYEKFLCEFAGQKRVLCLKCPVQYLQLERQIQREFGRTDVTMECAISGGEVFVAVTCQQDLDGLIEFVNSCGFSRRGYHIRLFSEPVSVSSADGVFLRSPDADQDTVRSVGSRMDAPDSPPPGTVPPRSSNRLSATAGLELEGAFIPEPESLEDMSDPLRVSTDDSRMGYFAPARDDSCYESDSSADARSLHSAYSVPCGFNSLAGEFMAPSGGQTSKNSETSHVPSLQHSTSTPTVSIGTGVRTPVNWKKGRMLGSGGFGQVFLCHDRDTGRDMAVKEVSVSCPLDAGSKEVLALQTELHLLQTLSHPHIVEYYGSTSSADGSLAIFMEYLPGGSVADHIKAHGCLTECLTRRYTRQVLEGLSYLHQKNIIHRDVKCANILRDLNGNVKIGDFGTSKQLQSITRMNSFCGTWYYMSPDIVSGDGYGCQTDIWSLGCTVVEMLSGKPPWHGLEGVAVIWAIGNCDKPKYKLPDSVSDDATNFLARCFVRNPRCRASAAELLHDPFVQLSLRTLDKRL